MSKNVFILAAFFILVNTAYAQSPTGKSPKQDRVSILFGLNQPIVFQGFNFEVDYWTKKWVFDYSHGFGLNVDGKLVGNDYSDQKIDFKITHSYGLGIGYRFTDAFNVRFEPKVHHYETYYEGAKQEKVNSIANFTTYTLGLGAYYTYKPFKNSPNLLKGITVVPSIRYWQRVASSIDDNKMAYFNQKTNKNEVLKVPQIGISNTPFLFNISVGYSF